jgi:hypothetical protein
MGQATPKKWDSQMRSKSQAAWETAAKCATLTEETDDPNEREYYARLRDAWITLAKRCEFSSISDVTGEILKTPLIRKRAAAEAMVWPRAASLHPSGRLPYWRRPRGQNLGTP